MWGTPRDLELINKMETKYSSLESFLNKNEMVYAEGFIRGTSQNTECPEFFNWPLIEARKFHAFSVNKDEQDRVDFTGFYRCAQKSKIIFNSPHLLFKQSPKKGRFLSSVLEYDALFGNSFIGIHGNEKLLKFLSIILYSKVFVYYSLMTSRRWLVERDELNVGELLSFPFPVPSESEVATACTLYDTCTSLNILEDDIDNFAYKIYNLKNYEIEFVENAVSNVYDYFYVKGNSQSFARPKKSVLNDYSKILSDILTKSLGTSDSITCNFYSSDAPLIIAQVLFGSSTIKSKNFDENIDVDELLNHLDKLLLSERSGSVAIKRNVRIYNKDMIYIIKPNQSRYWSYAFACRDADEIYADIMRTWSENNE